MRRNRAKWCYLSWSILTPAQSHYIPPPTYLSAPTHVITVRALITTAPAHPQATTALYLKTCFYVRHCLQNADEFITAQLNSFNSRGSDPLEEKVTPVADAQPKPRRNTDEDVEVELVSSLWSKFININNFLGRKSNGSLLLFIYTRNFILIFILDCLFGIHKLYVALIIDVDLQGRAFNSYELFWMLVRQRTFVQCLVYYFFFGYHTRLPDRFPLHRIAIMVRSYFFSLLFSR